MYQIKKEASIEIIEKKSKFITRGKLVKTEDEIRKIIEEISKKEKGASHNCYAFRILGMDMAYSTSNLIEKKSDDGEPGGTAGSPMLRVLAGENMINILAVTTRYFGGTKLGTGGLVNVYKRGVQELLKECGKEEFKIYSKWRLVFPINATNHAEYLLNKSKILISKKEFSKDVCFILDVPEHSENKLKEIAAVIHGEIKNIDT
ncbi:MAG: YigZ family protein [Spirochaetes bacterium]|nr:YigZ family protein [Spirochaetota bacterium]